MILIDEPYVSDFLFETARTHDIPIVDTPAARRFLPPSGVPVVSEEDAIRRMTETPGARIYTSSENALGWVAENLAGTRLPEAAHLFKDKLAFRRLVSPMFPDFFFRGVRFDEMDELDADELPYPFIIKPAVGFFSMGVYRVDDAGSWQRVKAAIAGDIEATRGLYPESVMDAGMFIMEELIHGEEYAIDAYFDAEGRPVITNIMHHIFPSGDDMRDRVYLTSRRIIVEHHDDFTAFLSDVGKRAELKNFPVHVEVRVDASGRAVPIEVNPMRFGGWCTTADLGWYAYGINSYAMFFADERPDWDAVLPKTDDAVYAIVILDNSTGYPADRIASFDIDRLAATFRKPLNVRPVDYHAYPVFGFVFTETDASSRNELDRILRSDLREFAVLND